MTTAPARIDLTILQGATFSEPFTWATLEDGASEAVLTDLTGYTARCQVRPDVDSETVYLEFTVENGRILIEPLLGRFTLRLSATSTGALDFTRGVYDVELESASGNVTRLIEGVMTVSKQVTR